MATHQGPPDHHPGWVFYRKIGSPMKVVAPMVDQSELAFRLLCRRYGADLCYTPMINSGSFISNAISREEILQDVKNQQDRPLIAQFCGDNPDVLLQAARHVEPYVDAVDLNLGCPQGIARRGHYGAFLLTETELLYDIVSKLSHNLSIPVTCKIRLLPTLEATLSLCHTLCRAGCSMLVVHGRTKEEKQQAIGPADWDAIRRIKQALPIPVMANGGISNLDDVERCIQETGVDGVMSSEAVLENPGLFSRNMNLLTGTRSTQEDLCMEYLELAEQHPPPNLKFIRAHVFKMLHTDLQVYTDLRDRVGVGQNLQDLRAIVEEAKGRRAATNWAYLGPTWYDRHKAEKREGREPAGQSQARGVALESTLEFDPSVTGLFGAEDDGEDAY